jgi:hypothetical protein
MAGLKIGEMFGDKYAPAKKLDGRAAGETVERALGFKPGALLHIAGEYELRPYVEKR